MARRKNEIEETCYFPAMWTDDDGRQWVDTVKADVPDAGMRQLIEDNYLPEVLAAVGMYTNDAAGLVMRMSGVSYVTDYAGTVVVATPDATSPRNVRNGLTSAAPRRFTLVTDTDLLRKMFA